MNQFRDFLVAFEKYEAGDSAKNLLDEQIQELAQQLQSSALGFLEISHMHSDISTGRLLIALVSLIKRTKCPTSAVILLGMLNNICADSVVRDILLEHLGPAGSAVLIETVVDRINDGGETTYQFIQLLHNLTFRKTNDYPSLQIMELMPRLAQYIEGQDQALLCPSLAALASCTRSNVAIKVRFFSSHTQLFIGHFCYYFILSSPAVPNPTSALPNLRTPFPVNQ